MKTLSILLEGVIILACIIYIGANLDRGKVPAKKIDKTVQKELLA